MPVNESALLGHSWANEEFLTQFGDKQYIVDLLKSRRDFLALRRREHIAIRSVYIKAVKQIAKQLTKLSPGTGELTRNHLEALEKALTREIALLDQSVREITRTSIQDALILGARPIDNQLMRALREAEVPLDFVRLQRGFAEVNTAAVEVLWNRTQNGLRVSDRVWRNSQRARDAIRNVIEVGVAAGRDSVQIARDLEQYVRKKKRSLAKDYPNMMARMGKRVPEDLTYEALRLVRTEKAKAYNEGAYSRGSVSPSYKGVRWMLSDAHPFPDICDTLATQNLYGLGQGVYPQGEEPVVPHPNCLCFVIPVLEKTDDFVGRLIEWKNNPNSQPDIEEWYQGFYVPTYAI